MESQNLHQHGRQTVKFLLLQSLTGFWVTLHAKTHLDHSREHPIRQPGENKPQPRMNAGWQRAPYCIYQTHHTQLHHATISCLLISLWERDENDNNKDRWRARMVFAELRTMKKQLERRFCRWWVRPPWMGKPQRQQQTKILNTKKLQRCFHGSFLTSDLQGSFSWEFGIFFVSDFSQQNTVWTDTLVKKKRRRKKEKKGRCFETSCWEVSGWFTLPDMFMTRLLLCVGKTVKTIRSPYGTHTSNTPLPL